MDTIENHMMKIWDDVKDNNPKPNHFSFELSEYKNGEISVYGFYHLEKEAHIFQSVDELKAIIAEREILFRKF